MRDYYRILGVSARADQDEIKHAFRRLAREHHPDASGIADSTKFREITRAYEVLSDRQQRRIYDAERAAAVRPVPAGRERWFADEIAIDFPSTEAILERIRHSFFGSEERLSPVSAEIRLTPQEAVRGVSIPLDVPIRWTCRACGGRGEVWMEPCELCRGTGAAQGYHQVKLVLPPGVPHGVRLRFSVSPPAAPATLVELRIAIR
jgi:molecular chaperone DnaJ